jgi:hypothetical protein
VGTDRTAEQLFELVWDTMADVLGTAATATLVRRSVKRAAGRTAELASLEVRREGFDYSYIVPAGWRDPSPGALEELRELSRELSPLLVELTGPVIVRRLGAIADLRRSAIHFEETLR